MLVNPSEGLAQMQSMNRLMKDESTQLAQCLQASKQTKWSYTMENINNCSSLHMFGPAGHLKVPVAVFLGGFAKFASLNYPSGCRTPAIFWNGRFIVFCPGRIEGWILATHTHWLWHFNNLFRPMDSINLRFLGRVYGCLWLISAIFVLWFW